MQASRNRMVCPESNIKYVQDKTVSDDSYSHTSHLIVLEE
jgi:hypothetical protein